MLVLSRKKDQSVRIGDGIEILVLGVHGNKVRLGFKADPSVKILRTELIERDRQNDTPQEPSNS